MTESIATEDNVWYRQFYVWLIIFLPACAVAASFATLYIAAKNPPQMAVDDYAGIEAIAAEQMARDQRALELGLAGQLSFADGAVVAEITAADQARLPSEINLRIQHSTTQEFDAQASLKGSDGRYVGTVVLPDGAYDIHLENPERTWRLSTRVSGQPESVALAAYGAANQ